jgi:uncharacterized Zn-finger protein
MDPLGKPHFHNAPGAAQIRIGVKVFMCIGDLPPSDHPHVFIDMGARDEAICPYCATHFIYDARLGQGCEPPECAYNLEPETEFSGPPPTYGVGEGLESLKPAPEQLPRPVLVPKGGFIASFASERLLREAMARFANDNMEPPRSYTPKQREDAPKGSPLPVVILLAGLLGAAAGFGMQAHANIIGYPLDIGGRPEFSWPSFVPIAFEIGVLCAVLAGVFGYFIAAKLPSLYEAIDEHDAMRRAMRDRFTLAARYGDDEQSRRARAILQDLGGREIEETPP